MRNSNRAAVRRPSLGLKKLALATLAALPVTSWAFGVGDAELRSAYAQPLSLRVPITIGESDHIVDATELSVRLLPYAAYEGMGLSAPPLNAEAVTLSVSGSGSAYWVELSSSQRIREPMLTLLLEVRLAGMRVVRELPIMFDLPAEPPARRAQLAHAEVMVAPPAPAPAPVPEPVAEADVVGTPLAQPQDGAPVELFPPAAVTPRPPRTIIRRAPKTAAAPKIETAKSMKLAQPAMFKLAGWNQSAAVPQAPMPRFQLAQHFDSYAALVAAGTPPVPATQVPVIALAPAPVAAMPVAAEQAPQESAGFGWLWALLLAGVAAVAVFFARRPRREPGGVMSATSMGTVVAVPEPVKVKAAAPRPAPVAQPEQEFELDIQPVQAVTPPPAAVPAPAPAPIVFAEPAAAQPAPQGDLKKRLAELVAKASGDANLLRKAQLVSAYLDLNRIESAETLLSELEAEISAPARPKFTLIKG